MTTTLRQLAVEITAFINSPDPGEETFNRLATELFAFQFARNAPLRRLSAGRGSNTPRVWQEIPAAPVAAFKEMELTVLPSSERVATFHSSGTTGHKPSRHFHSQESLAVYEASLVQAFNARIISQGSGSQRLLVLTPPPAQAPNSSLVHMFETLRRRRPVIEGGSGSNGSDGLFLGEIGSGDAWCLRHDEVLAALGSGTQVPVGLLGTAFNFVHLLDRLAGTQTRFRLPPGSFLMETGGYKGRSRSMPREELHQALAAAFGISQEQIICEYGMSELSSQAYDLVVGETRRFHFPHWTRIEAISPETGAEVADGEPGLLRVCDLANVASALVVQTEDLVLREGNSFELLGRAPSAAPRGCSLMTA
jgi:hypothetical protein